MIDPQTSNPQISLVYQSANQQICKKKRVLGFFLIFSFTYVSIFWTTKSNVTLKSQKSSLYLNKSILSLYLEAEKLCICWFPEILTPQIAKIYGPQIANLQIVTFAEGSQI